MFKLHIPIFYKNKYQMALKWRVCINFTKPWERERERDREREIGLFGFGKID